MTPPLRTVPCLKVLVAVGGVERHFSVLLWAKPDAQSTIRKNPPSKFFKLCHHSVKGHLQKTREALWCGIGWCLVPFKFNWADAKNLFFLGESNEIILALCLDTYSREFLPSIV